MGITIAADAEARLDNSREKSLQEKYLEAVGYYKAQDYERAFEILEPFASQAVDLKKAEYFLQQAAQHDRYHAYVGLYELELQKGNNQKAVDWLIEGMNHGYLLAIKELMKYFREAAKQKDAFLYYETLSKCISIETDRFEKYNANTTRDQVLTGIQEEIGEFCKNPYRESPYESKLNSLLQLDIPDHHREVISQLLEDYYHALKKLDQSVKVFRAFRIIFNILPAVTSILYYFKAPSYGLGFFGIVLVWSIPIALAGIILELKKQHMPPWYGALWALAFAAVCVFLMLFNIEKKIWLAIPVSVNISSQNLSDNSEWQARHIDI